MNRVLMTQKELKIYLKYDKNTGIFTWIKKRNIAGRIKVGDIAGCIMGDGYILIGAGKESKKMLAHRLAFLYMTGEVPEYIDHINHIRTDNRWVNLRPSNHQINSKNKLIQKNNTSGFSGVRFEKKRKKWVAEIGFNNRRIYLGEHKIKETAITIRKAAEGWYGFHKNHGASL